MNITRQIRETPAYYANHNADSTLALKSLFWNPKAGFLNGQIDLLQTFHPTVFLQKGRRRT